MIDVAVGSSKGIREAFRGGYLLCFLISGLFQLRIMSGVGTGFVFNVVFSI